MDDDNTPKAPAYLGETSGGHQHPGLVIAWRRRDDGWEGYVAVAREGTVLITWEQASRLHPVVDDGWQLPPRGG